MITKTKSLVPLLASTILASPAHAALVSLSVDSVLTPVGDNMGNEVTPVANATTRYQMSGDDGSGGTLNAILRVELLTFTSNLASHHIELGQDGTGLVGIGIAPTVANMAFGAVYRFSFFEDNAGVEGSTLSLDTILQTSDIDDVEVFTVRAQDFQQYGVGNTTNIIGTAIGGTLDVSANANNTTKTDPAAAVNFYGTGLSSFEIALSSDGTAGGREFQFDFKNPPDINIPDIDIRPVVPEPSISALMLLSLSTLVLRRKRP